MDLKQHSRHRARGALGVLAGLSLTAALLAPAAARAEWQAEGRAEFGGRAQQAHLGLQVPLGGPLRQGLVQRMWLDWESDSYGTGSASREVDSSAAGYALGYRSRGSAGWWGGYLGLQYRKPDRKPQREDEEKDQPWSLGLHLEGELALGPDWLARGQLTTFPSNHGYEVRGSLLRDIGGGFSLGPEIVLESDRDGSAQQLGMVLRGFRPMPDVEGAVKVGVQRSEGGDTGGYVGLEFTRRF